MITGITLNVINILYTYYYKCNNNNNDTRDIMDVQDLTVTGNKLFHAILLEHVAL